MACRRASVLLQRGQGSPSTALRRSAKRSGLEIAARIDARQVRVGRVGAGDAVDDALDVAVGIERDFFLHAHRAGKAHRRAGHLFDRRRIGQLDLAAPGGAADLALVGVVVAADQHGDRLAVGQVDERLDHLLRLAAEELAHLLDGAWHRAWPLFPAAFGRGIVGRTMSRLPISAFSWLAA